MYDLCPGLLNAEALPVIGVRAGVLMALLSAQETRGRAWMGCGAGNPRAPELLLLRVLPEVRVVP